jgi:hypothetical protein
MPHDPRCRRSLVWVIGVPHRNFGGKLLERVAAFATPGDEIIGSSSGWFRGIVSIGRDATNLQTDRPAESPAICAQAMLRPQARPSEEGALDLSGAAPALIKARGTEALSAADAQCCHHSMDLAGGWPS